jgi:hypothetical protein
LLVGWSGTRRTGIIVQVQYGIMVASDRNHNRPSCSPKSMEPFISIPAGDVLFTFSHWSFTEAVPNLIEACQALPIEAMRERALNQPDDHLTKMEETRKKWVEEEEDDTDRMLNDAIALSVENGKGWAPGKREAYLKTILDDDFIPPIFAGSQEELDRSGLAEAFSW